eukprot:Lankesteria_metandrocarpae@DN4501_c0_g1_i1.p1
MTMSYTVAVSTTCTTRRSCYSAASVMSSSSRWKSRGCATLLCCFLFALTFEAANANELGEAQRYSANGCQLSISNGDNFNDDNYVFMGTRIRSGGEPVYQAVDLVTCQTLPRFLYRRSHGVTMYDAWDIYTNDTADGTADLLNVALDVSGGRIGYTADFRGCPTIPVAVNFAAERQRDAVLHSSTTAHCTLNSTAMPPIVSLSGTTTPVDGHTDEVVGRILQQRATVDVVATLPAVLSEDYESTTAAAATTTTIITTTTAAATTTTTITVPAFVGRTTTVSDTLVTSSSSGRDDSDSSSNPSTNDLPATAIVGASLGVFSLVSVAGYSAVKFYNHHRSNNIEEIDVLEDDVDWVNENDDEISHYSAEDLAMHV